MYSETYKDIFMFFPAACGGGEKHEKSSIYEAIL
jgi:hypothetical protein